MGYLKYTFLLVIISSCFMILQSFASAAGPEKNAQPANPVVLMKTSLGTIRIELWPAKAPETVKNFLQYVDEGFYDGTIFHRVINNFMIQGGGFTARYETEADPCPHQE